MNHIQINKGKVSVKLKRIIFIFFTLILGQINNRSDISNKFNYQLLDFPINIRIFRHSFLMRFDFLEINYFKLTYLIL
jgi:hypothetical protein